MSLLFSKETASSAMQGQDKAKLAEMDSHQLLQAEEPGKQVATFDQVKTVGDWFLKQNYNSVLPSNKPLPAGLLQNHRLRGNQPFLAKLALGSDSQNHFPVTVEVVTTSTGKEDLRLHIVPINFEALEVAQHSKHTDSLLALAAASAIAPQFILGLEGGLTGDCSTQTEQTGTIAVDHATPLAAIFESFQAQSNVYQSASQATGNNNLTLKQAAHLHHLPENSSTNISIGAGMSKIAAGVTIRTLNRSQLPKHALFIPTSLDQNGQTAITSLNESIFANDPNYDLGLIATALGMTSTVVGNGQREQKIEKVLSLKSGDVTLREVIG